jgi:hypothetical protein
VCAAGGGLVPAGAAPAGGLAWGVRMIGPAGAAGVAGTAPPGTATTRDGGGGAWLCACAFMNWRIKVGSARVAARATGTRGVSVADGTTVTAPGTPVLAYMIGPVGTVPGCRYCGGSPRQCGPFRLRR